MSPVSKSGWVAVVAVEVSVWTTESSFLTMTRSPGRTVARFGTNAKFVITIVMDAVLVALTRRELLGVVPPVATATLNARASVEAPNVIDLTRVRRCQSSSNMRVLALGARRGARAVAFATKS